MMSRCGSIGRGYGSTPTGSGNPGGGLVVFDAESLPNLRIERVLALGMVGGVDDFGDLGYRVDDCRLDARCVSLCALRRGECRRDIGVVVDPRLQVERDDVKQALHVLQTARNELKSCHLRELFFLRYLIDEESNLLILPVLLREADLNLRAFAILGLVIPVRALARVDLFLLCQIRIRGESLLLIDGEEDLF